MTTENNKPEKQLDKLVGARLKALRIVKGLSQTELGQHAGISFQQIQKCENGSNRIGAGRLWLFCKILDVDANQFFGDISEEASDLNVGVKPPSGEWSDMLSRQNYKLLVDFAKIKDPMLKSSLMRICEGLAMESNSTKS